PKNSELPYEQLFVPMGVDESGRDMLLQIQFIPVDLSEVGGTSIFDIGSTNLVNLQFYYFLPFTIKEAYFSEVARVVAGLNKSCIVPGFEFSEADSMVCYRSSLLANEEVDEAILMTVVSTVISSIDIF